MKTSEFNQGKFKLKDSPYPQSLVCDYPETFKTLSYLEGKLRFYMDSETTTYVPQAMVNGVALKVERTRKRLREKKDGKPQSNPFFIFPD